MEKRELCPRCESARKEWMDRSPNGESRCAGCGFQGPHAKWQTVEVVETQANIDQYLIDKTKRSSKRGRH